MKLLKIKNSANTVAARKICERGYTLVELLIVMIVMAIAATMSLFYFAGHSKLYDYEDQALKIVDMLQYARQLSLTQRKTMRVEFNMSRNTVRLIDENVPGDANDDREIRTLTLRNVALVRVDRRPGNISASDVPPCSSPCPGAVFANSVHPSSQAQSVATIRYTRNGDVMSAGLNGTAGSATLTGATFFVWTPDSAAPNNVKSLGMTRAVTILSTGATRLWGHLPNSTTAGANGTGWVVR